jgi:NAD(P)-dependent dehydrogenase (short-subunit alcohol dehydrogenase family)
MSSLKVRGTTALVTGANRGIGRALVEALLARGAAKVYAAARGPEALVGLAHADVRVIPIRLDVTVPADIQAASELAADVQLLINNAGVVAQLGGELTDERWIASARTEHEVNVLGTLAVTQAFAAVLARNGGGAILNLSSVAALVSFPSLASYSASKAAVHSLTQATRALLRPHHTFVAGVYPGPIDTEMVASLPIQKTPPAVAAHAILDGLEAGQEEIFPDPTARQIGEQYFSDPKALERTTAA